MPNSPANVDLSDPRWLPFDLDLSGERLRFLRIDERVLEQSVFLDHRIALVDRTPVDVPLNTFARRASGGAQHPAFLFHTSFCCSTLLARALHVSPYTEALKEPFALRRLSDAAHAGTDVDGWLAPVVELLARPWSVGSHTLIKPTHVALNIAAQLLQAAPGARALLLYSGLEDFLVSNLKKPPETQDKVGRLAARLAADAGLEPDLLPRAQAAAGWPGEVVVQWMAAMTLVRRLLDRAPDRVRMLRDTELLAGFERGCTAAAAWLELDVPDRALAARIADVAAQHAKVTAAAYDAARRAEEAAFVRKVYAAAITRALAWAEQLGAAALQTASPASRLLS